MTREILDEMVVSYWRSEARRLSAANTALRNDIDQWRNKYHRAVRIMRRFMWATCILGALLGMCFWAFVIVAGAK